MITVKLNIGIIVGGILILSGFLAAGCGRPKGVLSDKEMVELITDMKLAEAYSNNHMTGVNSATQKEQLSKAVLAAHKVTQENLDTTLGWYGRNLDKYADLYEKVDKRLLEKRKTLLKDGDDAQLQLSGDNLWSFGQNGIISTFGNSDGWIISIPEPELSQGDRLEWTMHLHNTTAALTGVLGVEYMDGTSEAVNTYFTNRPSITLSLQTDTGKMVGRIYGTLRLKKADNLPLFVDSIALKRLPFDSLEYSKYRVQKKYGYPVRITQEDRMLKLKADSIRKDSIQKAAALRRDSINSSKVTPAVTTSNSNAPVPIQAATPAAAPKAPQKSPISRPRPGKAVKPTEIKKN